MDETTLRSHQDLWVGEKDQHAAETLPLLTDPEQAVNQMIKRNIWGQNVRIWTPPRLASIPLDGG
jgi:hypothetical protein